MKIGVTLGNASYALYRIGAKPVLSVEIDASGPEEYDVDRGWAGSIFADVIALRVSPVPSNSAMGVGGSSVEISIERGFNRSTFQWWQSVPERWEPLAEIADRIQSQAMRCRPHYPG